MRLIDLTGQRFGKLTVISRAQNQKHGDARWTCQCECGGSTTTSGNDLRRGHTTSCGCAVAAFNRATRTTHGHTAGHRSGKRSAEYSIWSSMIKRCENPNHHAYPRYGGRGITVHPSWRADFAAFLRDVGPRPSPELSLDRIDNDGNYEPGNVRWATATQQAQNRRNSKGKP